MAPLAGGTVGQLRRRREDRWLLDLSGVRLNEGSVQDRPLKERYWLSGLSARQHGVGASNELCPVLGRQGHSLRTRATRSERRLKQSDSLARDGDQRMISMQVMSHCIKRSCIVALPRRLPVFGACQRRSGKIDTGAAWPAKVLAVVLVLRLIRFTTSVGAEWALVLADAQLAAQGGQRPLGARRALAHLATGTDRGGCLWIVKHQPAGINQP